MIPTTAVEDGVSRVGAFSGLGASTEYRQRYAEVLRTDVMLTDQVKSFFDHRDDASFDPVLVVAHRSTPG